MNGAIGIMILISIPAWYFYKADNFQKAFISSFFLFWFLTINHSAMRIAFPGFLYALCLMKITDDGSK